MSAAPHSAAERTAARAEVTRGITELCEWAAALDVRAIPASTLSHAVLVLGDNIAATLSAADEPEIRAWHERTIAARTAEQATIFRLGAPRASLAETAVANGLAITWNELDEGYTRVAVHAGALSQPLVLAAAESDGAPLAAMLRAVIGAYEVGARLARAWPGTLPRLHPHGIYNAVCAATGLALLRGASAAELERALTAAATMVSPGPYSHPIEGALVRNAWPAAGAWLGLFACDLARVGIGGLASGLYDVFELGLGAPSHAAELTDGLGTDWAICAGYHKLHPACHHSHAAIEAIEALRDAHPELAGGGNVEHILVEGSAMAANFANAEPRTTLAAKFSIPHAAAGAVVLGADDPRVFGAAGLHHPGIAALRARVTLGLMDVKPWPYNRPARVTITTRDGRSLTASCEAAFGSPSRPLTEDRILAKIDELSRRDAPGLAREVTALRAAVATGAVPDGSSRDWIRRFFA